MSEMISQLPAASTIDAVQDVMPVVNNALNQTQRINRNTLLGITGLPVGTSDTQTLTNKILTNATINGATLSGTLVGTYTIGGTPTFPAVVVQTTVSQTLTNKILTSPTINSPTITNATISADALTGYTNANNGTLYGISISSSVITGANSVASGALQQNSVSAANLATSAITLGYAQITSSFNVASGTSTQVTGLTLTVTIPAGGRRIRVTAWSRALSNSSAGHYAFLNIWDGTVAGGTQLAEAQIYDSGGATGNAAMAVAIISPAAGSKTYNIGLRSDGTGTATCQAASTYPAFILVEAI